MLFPLKGAIDVALGSGATGAFTNSEELWRRFSCAGAKTGDRLWRMPLWNHFSRQVTESHLADINNVGKHGRSAGACTAAAFLKVYHFVLIIKRKKKKKIKEPRPRVIFSKWKRSETKRQSGCVDKDFRQALLRAKIKH